MSLKRVGFAINEFEAKLEVFRKYNSEEPRVWQGVELRSVRGNTEPKAGVQPHLSVYVNIGRSIPNNLGNRSFRTRSPPHTKFKNINLYSGA